MLWRRDERARIASRVIEHILRGASRLTFRAPRRSCGSDLVSLVAEHGVSGAQDRRSNRDRLCLVRPKAGHIDDAARQGWELPRLAFCYPRRMPQTWDYVAERGEFELSGDFISDQ